MGVNAYQLYKKTQISTASQGDLILMLFGGALKFSRQARTCILAGEMEQANAKLIRAQDIMTELMVSLDLDTGEMAHNLHQLYSFVHSKLVQANIKKDIVSLDQATKFLEDLRDMWREVVEKVQ